MLLRLESFVVMLLVCRVKVDGWVEPDLRETAGSLLPSSGLLSRVMASLIWSSMSCSCCSAKLISLSNVPFDKSKNTSFSSP